MRPMLLLACVAALVVAAYPAQSATFTVTRTANSGPGSLRDAIAQANSSGPPDTILFAAAMDGKAIRPSTPLPPLTDDGTTIDGDIDDNNRPDIILDGAMAGGTGIEVRSSENVVRGLNIRRFENGIWIHGTGAANNVVACNHVGTDLRGTYALGNTVGVYVSGLARDTVIGGTTRPDRNVISGNAEAGVLLEGADDSTVVGNFIGVDYRGLEPIGNAVGVHVRDCQDTSIGDGTAGGRNLISGQSSLDGPRGAGDTLQQGPSETVGGVVITRGARHTVRGNYIGTNHAGTAAVGNDGAGVAFQGVTDSTIGGPGAGDRNVISGNGGGIRLEGCRDVTVAGNHVGTDAAGRAAIGNSGGVSVGSCRRATIGGLTSSCRNVISGNRDVGLNIAGSSDTFVYRNYIGVSATGGALGNGRYGVYMGETLGTRIGGPTAYSGNVISANEGEGIYLTTHNWQTTITRNLIGRDPTGTGVMPNRSHPITVYGEADALTIGGASAGRGNRLACREGTKGISLSSGSTTGLVIRNNEILGPSGTGNRGEAGISGDLGYHSDSSLTGRIADNVVRRFDGGLKFSGSNCVPIVAGNTLSNCAVLIYINYDAKPNLGNLGNASAADDGGNVFRNADTYAVQNFSAEDILAEGNDWGTTSAAAIGALIYDWGDAPGSGVVDFDPLIGGVTPTGVGIVQVQLSGLAAVPTRLGAEVVFSLSAPAEVSGEIVNIAGRPVAALAPRPGEAGLNRVVWNGISAQGTPVASGVYLVRLTAHDRSGAQASGLARVRLER